MIKSMTAYGRGEYQKGDIVFVAEMRSLNNRYRDIILRIPKNYQILENELKPIISNRIRRGRVEVTVQMENNGEAGPYNFELNLPLVDSYFKVFNELVERFGLDQEIELGSILQMKDAILLKPEERDLEEVKTGFEAALGEALDSLDEMRLKEGNAIRSDLVNRLGLLEKYLNTVGKRAPILVEEYREKLNDRINHMLKDVTVDENRLAQEVAFFSERSDVTEEIVRIRSHLQQFREYLSFDNALGRRLDFLIQEINREVNTLSSKASDSSISKVSVEMKAELEKLREQIQNVE
ncbi:MAG: YicC/YloC family endoribonuclease [Desulfatiglandaceae bacterium]